MAPPCVSHNSGMVTDTVSLLSGHARLARYSYIVSNIYTVIMFLVYIAISLFWWIYYVDILYWRFHFCLKKFVTVEFSHLNISQLFLSYRI